MSSAVVETVAWLALAAVVGLGAVVVVLHRRLEALARAHSDRKWELAVLRSEMGDIRRGLGNGEDDDAAPPRIPEQPGGDADTDGARPARTSPTAWRRDRARPPARPRRRRPG